MDGRFSNSEIRYLMQCDLSWEPARKRLKEANVIIIIIITFKKETGIEL